MKILKFKSLPSTHLYIKEYISKHGYKEPLLIVTQEQQNGIGSRDNTWEGKKGNLFFSFVINQKLLPNDLPIQSASIYFSFILKNILKSMGSKTWIKWPNDFYCYNKKIGGIITNVTNGLLYCGIGLNLLKINKEFGYLDIDVNIDILLELYSQKLEKYPSWKQIISKYEVEFYNNYNCLINRNILLKNAILQKDGSLLIDDRKVFSLR
jgi:BirA family biotin operon repressor/biotin-[acetyl-CoA-carboxylase] ligase